MLLSWSPAELSEALSCESLVCRHVRSSGLQEKRHCHWLGFASRQESAHGGGGQLWVGVLRRSLRSKGWCCMWQLVALAGGGRHQLPPAESKRWYFIAYFEVSGYANAQ